MRKWMEGERDRERKGRDENRGRGGVLVPHCPQKISPLSPDVLHWLLLRLLHYWIKSFSRLPRVAEREEGGVRGHDLG